MPSLDRRGTAPAMNDRTDEITEALTEGSTYEQFRLRHGMLFSSSIEAKTRYCLYLLWLSARSCGSRRTPPRGSGRL